MKNSLSEHYANFPNMKFGHGTYGGLQVLVYDDTKLTVGAYCSFGIGTRVLLGGEHHLDWVTTYPFNKSQERSRGDVTIGNDVWVGTDALILSGVTIGDGAVIGARAVVTKEVRPYEIVGGVPAKNIGYRFSTVRVIERLQKIAWWDWPEDRIQRAQAFLLSADVETFITVVENGKI